MPQPSRPGMKCPGKAASLTEIIQYALFGANRVEPKKRWVGGRFGWAVHRFPIKGGVSMTVVLSDNICKNNAMIESLKRVR